MKKVLLTTICRPLGPQHGDAPSVGYELLYGQVTRAQGLFSPRATHVQFSLEYIAQNIDAPTTVLQYPSKRELIRELKKGCDYVGMAFILSTFHRMREVVALVRRYAPGAKIVLGGYGTVLTDEELAPYGDFVCRGEGVGFMRRLLGEEPRPMPYEHPMVVSRLKIFSLPVSETGMVFAGLGCANGCDFCCTSHFFKRRHIRLLDTGKDIFDVMCRYQDEKGVDQFTILDEDFLLNKRRAEEFRKCVLESGRTFSTFAFASIRALNQYRPKELLEMGIDGLWVGYEGTRSGYDKQKGRPPAELFPEFTKNGILVLASMIVGFDYQDREVVREELRGLLRLRPALTQFLIYGPTPGTPFYDRMIRENRMRPELHADKETYYRNCSGFISMVRHPKLSKEDIERLQAECFEADYRRLGPSMHRSVRVWLNGYLEHRRSPSPALRKKALRFRREVRKAYPIFLAGRLLGPNPRIRRWVAAFERRLHREIGAPTLAERALSVAALGMALLTRLTLCFDYFQHPRLKPARHRFGSMQEEFYRFVGEMRAGGAARELRATLQRRLAERLAWITVEGAFDAKSVEAFSRKFSESLKAGRGRMVISLENVKWLDRKGLAMFYRKFRHCRKSLKVRCEDFEALRDCRAEVARLIEYFSISECENPT